MVNRRNKYYIKIKGIICCCQMNYNTTQLDKAFYTSEYLENCSTWVSIKEMNDHPIEGDGLHVNCTLKNKKLTINITL